MTVSITKVAYDKIVEHAQAMFPIEACGYLAGTNGVISLVYPMTNAENSTTHFSLVPKEQFKVLEEVISKDAEILGNYHSHPYTSAEPSEEDIRLAFDTDTYYFIVSLAGDEPEVNAFLIKDYSATIQNLKIV